MLPGGRLTLILALIALVVVAWRVGVEHRRNCINAGKVGCNLLPWSGTYGGVGVPTNQGISGALRKSFGPQVGPKFP